MTKNDTHLHGTEASLRVTAEKLIGHLRVTLRLCFKTSPSAKFPPFSSRQAFVIIN